MKLYVNERSEIKDVATTSETSLTEVVVSDEGNPFVNWSKAKICCYKVVVDDNGYVTMMTPYVDTKLIEHIDELGKANEVLQEQVILTNTTVEDIMTTVIPSLYV